ncbi:hypothetical protein H6F90_20870 [Trichocoleus sp. FACHB-591]|uniref:hypothetical protein n=1 Tax=Trichocoleus sp. FACHB-591 TaxID=2692872 RepID=UPI0016832BD9|nr:hypothetical protein [Trichocoleus sp. FACHB-591]MBD2097553.1 hypothetical protein [Trichocoleus sp. FACHB-591]
MLFSQQNEQSSRNPLAALLRQAKFLSVAIALSLAVFLWGCDDLTAANLPTPAETVAFEQSLAQHLQQTGAKMYGAYWCPHCADQKALFGPAVATVPYVECDPKGEKPQPDLCQAKQIEGYPTWEIGDHLYSGTRSLLELAALSGYKAPAVNNPSAEVSSQTSP